MPVTETGVVGGGPPGPYSAADDQVVLLAMRRSCNSNMVLLQRQRAQKPCRLDNSNAGCARYKNQRAIIQLGLALLPGKRLCLHEALQVS